MSLWPLIAGGWIAQTLIATSLLMAIVILLREPAGHAFGARAAYALWLLPALRMILPPLPFGGLFPPMGDEALPVETALAALGDAAAPIGTGSVPIPGTAALPADPTPLAWLGINLPGIIMGLWLGAAAMWFALQVLRYRHFLSRAMDGAVMLPRDGGVELWVSPIVTGPIAVGIVRRRILLPPDFLMRYAPEERALVLSHEAAHHARLDILANLAALMVRALHWWNPIAHAAYRRFRADQELACDATVLRSADAERRAAYGRTLIKSAVPRMPALVSALDPRIEFTRRISMMTRKPLGAVRLFAGAALAATMIGGGVMATASAIAPEAPATPAAPAIPAVPPMPAAIRATQIPPSAPVAPQPPRAPETLAAIDPPEPPVPPTPPTPSTHHGKMTIVTSRGTFHSYGELTPAEREQIRTAHETAREAVRAAAEARREGMQARAEAHREAAEARREAAQARQEALREAAEARAEALAEAGAARADASARAHIGPEQAMRAANAAQARALAEQQRVIRDIPRMVEASLARARARMAVACKEKGVAMAPGSDFGALAMCGEDMSRTIRTALTAARASIAASRDLSDEARNGALKGLDDAMADLDRQPSRQ